MMKPVVTTFPILPGVPFRPTNSIGIGVRVTSPHTPDTLYVPGGQSLFFTKFFVEALLAYLMPLLMNRNALQTSRRISLLSNGDPVMGFELQRTHKKALLPLYHVYLHWHSMHVDCVREVCASLRISFGSQLYALILGHG